jgi:hypothetical protein
MSDSKQKIYIYKVLTKESRQDGRPDKYNEIYHPKAAYEIMALGATKTKCAQILAINRDTLYSWIREYTEFSDAIKRGMDKFVVDNVELGLNKRAIGFTFDEKVYERPPIPTIIVAKGEKKKDYLATIAAYMDAQEPVLMKRTTKYYPPDVTAIKYFLGNREPDRWPKNGDLPGEGALLFYTQADVAKMLADEKKTLDRVPAPQKPKKEKQDETKKVSGKRGRKINSGTRTRSNSK